VVASHCAIATEGTLVIMRAHQRVQNRQWCVVLKTGSVDPGSWLAKSLTPQKWLILLHWLAGPLSTRGSKAQLCSRSMKHGQSPLS